MWVSVSYDKEYYLLGEVVEATFSLKNSEKHRFFRRLVIGFKWGNYMFDLNEGQGIKVSSHSVRQIPVRFHLPDKLELGRHAYEVSFEEVHELESYGWVYSGPIKFEPFELEVHPQPTDKILLFCSYRPEEQNEVDAACHSAWAFKVEPLLARDVPNMSPTDLAKVRRLIKEIGACTAIVSPRHPVDGFLPSQWLGAEPFMAYQEGKLRLVFIKEGIRIEGPLKQLQSEEGITFITFNKYNMDEKFHEGFKRLREILDADKQRGLFGLGLLGLFGLGLLAFLSSRSSPSRVR